MLTWILAAGAVLCLAYFITIVIYSGIGTAYAFIWFVFAAGLGITAFCVRWYERYPRRIPLRLPVSLVTLCGAGLVIMLMLQFLIIGKVPQVADSDLEYVIVLGASVKGEKPGRTLELRLDKAAEYALQKGVKDEQMILETNSTSTVENIAYSRMIIDVLRKQKQEHHQDERALPAYLPSVMMQRPDHSREIGILTSNFHLYRALQVAKKQGMTKVSGIASPSDRILFLHFCFRDGLAVLKERLAGNI